MPHKAIITFIDPNLSLPLLIHRLAHFMRLRLTLVCCLVTLHRILHFHKLLIIVPSSMLLQSFPFVNPQLALTEINAIIDTPAPIFLDLHGGSSVGSVDTNLRLKARISDVSQPHYQPRGSNPRKKARTCGCYYLHPRQAVPDPPDMGSWAPTVTSATGLPAKGHHTAHNSAKSVLGLLA